MNRWLTLRRLRGPAFLLLFGVTAMLNQWGVLSFARSWPLYLILAGVLTLLERAAFREDLPPPVTGYAPQGYAPASPVYPPPSPGSAITPAETSLGSRSDEITHERGEL